jgi:hypothetical protein
MPAVLLGLTGLDKIGSDPEIEPPRRELGESSDRDGGRERSPVVGSDSVGEAVAPEEPKKRGFAALQGRGGESPAIQKEPAVGVLHGEGVAELSVARPELTLEVRGPEVVGSVGLERRGSRLLQPSSGFPGSDQVMPLQDPIDGGHRRGPPELLLEECAQLGSAPPSATPQLDDALLDFGWDPVRAISGSVGSISQSLQALGSVSIQPLVAGRSADAVPSAELREGEVGVLGFEDEAGSFIHDGLGPPRHWRLLAGGPSLRWDL